MTSVLATSLIVQLVQISVPAGTISDLDGKYIGTAPCIKMLLSYTLSEYVNVNLKLKLESYF